MSGIYFHDIATDERNPENMDWVSVDHTYCQECDKDHDSDLIFCPDCGERLKDVYIDIEGEVIDNEFIG